MEPRAEVPPGADHVIGVFAREGLSAALASTHRAGFGPQTRVIDSARGDAGKQLERLGLTALTAPWLESPPDNAVLIVVTAPGRTAMVADLFTRLGAELVVFAERRAAGPPATERIIALSPDIRIGEGAGAGPE